MDNLDLRRLLDRLDPGFIPTPFLCRDKQRSDIRSFLSTHCIDALGGGTLLLIGPPGTGKTAVWRAELGELTNRIDSSRGVVRFYNAVEWDLDEVCKEFSNRKRKRSEEDVPVAGSGSEDRFLSSVKQFVKDSGKLLVLAIDEIDRTLKPETLLALVEATARLRFVFVGIANDLSIIREAGWTRLRGGNPTDLEIVRFVAYGREQLGTIVRQRVGDVVIPKSVERAIVKSSSQSGDARVVLDLFRKEIESLVHESSSESTGHKSQIPSEERAVIAGLPLHAKVILFCVLKYLLRLSGLSVGGVQSCRVRDIKQEYATFANSRSSLSKLNSEEFDFAFNVLVHSSLLKIFRSNRESWLELANIDTRLALRELSQISELR